MGTDVAQAGDGASVAGKRPDIDRRDFLVRTGEVFASRVFQIDAVEQQCVMASAIEIEERDAAKQLSTALKGKNRLGIVAQEPVQHG